MILATMNTMQITLPFHPILAGAFAFIAIFVVVRVTLEIWSKVIP